MFILRPFLSRGVVPKSSRVISSLMRPSGGWPFRTGLRNDPFFDHSLVPRSSVFTEIEDTLAELGHTMRNAVEAAQGLADSHFGTIKDGKWTLNVDIGNVKADDIRCELTEDNRLCLSGVLEEKGSDFTRKEEFSYYVTVPREADIQTLKITTNEGDNRRPCLQICADVAEMQRTTVKELKIERKQVEGKEQKRDVDDE